MSLSFPHISGCDDEELVEAVSVMGQHGFQTRRSESKAEGAKTQIDDARVRLAMAKDELTEIADPAAALWQEPARRAVQGIVTTNAPGVVTTLRGPVATVVVYGVNLMMS